MLPKKMDAYLRDHIPGPVLQSRTRRREGRCHLVLGFRDEHLLAKMGIADPLLDIARKLEELALKDQYFADRRLYPNVDFYSGIVQRAIGVPTALFTAVFALARTVGWIAQWNEMLSDPEYKIGRPRQLFQGSVSRSVPKRR